MNAAIQEIIKKVEQAAKPASSVPWKPDTPHAQPIFTFDTASQTWRESRTAAAPEKKKDEEAVVTTLALLSWNIDFMLPHGRARMAAALGALRARLACLPAHAAAVVFLQECVADDLRAIGALDWVRAGFRVTDVDESRWASGYYGTTTLVDRRVAVDGVFRVHFGETRMQRDGLFVDVSIGGKGKVIRFCNTHLESLAVEPPLRPAQVAVAAKFMKEEAVHGALCELAFLFFRGEFFPVASRWSLHYANYEFT